MRTPTLLTGVTGAVSVLVLVYVGLTAMNLQPHITFGDPPVRVATVDQAPAKVETPAPAPSAPVVPATANPATVPPTTPSPSTPPISATTTTSPSASTGSKEMAAAPTAPGGDNAPVAAAIPGAAPPAVTEPTGVAPAVPSSAPVTAPATVPEAAPPAVTAAAPTVSGASPSVTTTPEVAAPAPEASTPAPLASASPPVVLPLQVPAPTDQPTDKAFVPEAPASVAIPPVPQVAVASPSANAKNDAISERMAPPVSLPASPLPLASSVPTPLARPRPPQAEKLASAAMRPPEDAPDKGEADNKAADKERAEKAQSEKGAKETSVQPAPAEAKPGQMQTAALTPQPQKLDDGISGQPQSSGSLKPVDLSRPFAERAGILTVGGRAVQLAGIVPTDPQRTCIGTDGKEWPCGTLARTALRSFLLGRTITCDVVDPAWKGSITADCRFAKLSIADWLARNGWAEVASGSPYTAAADEARKAGRGVYGNDPRKKHQSTLAPEPPKEDPLNPI